MKNDTIISKQFPPHQPIWRKKGIEKTKSEQQKESKQRNKKGRRERNEKENKNTMEEIIYLTRIS
jgi:hypothetical protein